MENNKFFKYVGFAVVIAVVFLLGISVGRQYSAPSDNQAVQDQVSNASLMIDYGDGKVKTYQDVSGSTVFNVLKNASEKNNFDLKYKDYGGELGMFIESIDGIGKDPSGKKWWQYWVNNKYSQVGVSAYTVSPGDVIELKFTQGQE
jgi:hypothetical protein